MNIAAVGTRLELRKRNIGYRLCRGGGRSRIGIADSALEVGREDCAGCCGSPSATLDIELDPCPNADTALRKLRACASKESSPTCPITARSMSWSCNSARSARCNQQAVAVAIVERAVGLEAVFEIGADFSLSKPLSSERAKSTFRDVIIERGRYNVSLRRNEVWR